MAQYQHLPIYKLTYDVLLRTMTATKDFPREYKFTLGQKIKDELIELVILIYRANSAADKARHIESIVERVQAIQLMMRLSHDMRILSRRHYAALSEMTDENFLNRRNKAQLEAILKASGTKKRFGNLLQGKKGELVKKLAGYFKSLLTKNGLTDEEQATRNWLPEAMQFPAIDPDACLHAKHDAGEQAAEDESEDFEGEDDEDASSDDEELAEAA